MKHSVSAAVAILLTVIILLFSGCVPNNDKQPENESTSAAENQSTTAEVAATQKLSADDKLIALTFDDGPKDASTGRILDILEKNNSRATFFVVGYNIEKNADIIKRAQSMGCEIGNHTNDHKILTKCTSDEIHEQVNKPNEMLKNLTGISPVLFRAPGGAFKGVKQEIGMPLIQWSIDTEDWKSKDAAHPDRSEAEREAELNRIANDVIENAQKGDIVLMHDIYNFTADLCEKIIPALVEKGFKLVTVSEMYEAYGEKLENGVVYYSIKPEEPTQPATQSTVILEPGNYTVKTNGGTLNVRIEPKQDSEPISKLSNGTEITVIKSVSGWAFVDAGNASGWVNAAYLIKS